MQFLAELTLSTQLCLLFYNFIIIFHLITLEAFLNLLLMILYRSGLMQVDKKYKIPEIKKENVLFETESKILAEADIERKLKIIR